MELKGRQSNQSQLGFIPKQTQPVHFEYPIPIDVNMVSYWHLIYILKSLKTDALLFK